LKNTFSSLKFFRFFGVILLCISILAVSDVQAQRKSKAYLKKKNKKIGSYKGGSIHFDKNKRYISLGFSIDALNYYGDIAPTSGFASTDISFTRPAFTIFGSYRYTPNLTLRGSLSWGRLQSDDYNVSDPYDADDKFRYIRNLSFRNNITELSAIAVWDFFPNHGTFLNRVNFTPYAFAGVGMFYHNPKAKAPAQDKNGVPLDEAGQWIALRPLGTEGQTSQYYDLKQYSLIQPSIPFGLGFRAKLQKRLDFEFEIGYRFLFTDYIDDVSGMYVDLGALDSDLARAMSDRSREPISATTSDPRNLEEIGPVKEALNLIHYTSEYNGEEYYVFNGFGQQNPEYNRGLSSDKDIYIVTSFKISYIISGSFKRAKFR
jgi:hypothetical protein